MIFGFLLLFITVCTIPSPGLLEEMQGKVASMGMVKISVNVQDADASVLTDGVGYHLQSETLEVWSDGKTQWVYSPSEGEITVSDAVAGSDDIWQNPAVLLTSEIQKSYDVVSEKGSYILLKAGKNRKVSYPQIGISVGKNLLPEKIDLKSISGETYVIRIVSVSPFSANPLESFRPSEALLRESFVNDMR